MGVGVGVSVGMLVGVGVVGVGAALVLATTLLVFVGDGDAAALLAVGVLFACRPVVAALPIAAKTLHNINPTTRQPQPRPAWVILRCLLNQSRKRRVDEGGCCGKGACMPGRGG